MCNGYDMNQLRPWATPDGQSGSMSERSRWQVQCMKGKLHAPLHKGADTLLAPPIHTPAYPAGMPARTAAQTEACNPKHFSTMESAAHFLLPSPSSNIAMRSV